MKKKIVWILVVSGCAVLWPRAGWAATTMSLSPATTQVTDGSTFSLDVDIAGVSDLYGFQFDVSFDPAVLAVNSVSEGAFLAGGGSTFFLPGTTDNVGGSVAAIANTLIGAPAGVNGAGTLVQIDFTAVGVGNSAVSLANLMLLDSTGTTIGAATSGGSVQVSAASAGAPEPSAGWLLLTGLSGLSAVVRVKRRCRQGR